MSKLDRWLSFTLDDENATPANSANSANSPQQPQKSAGFGFAAPLRRVANPTGEPDGAQADRADPSAFDERAAIIEYDGGLPREYAEAQAGAYCAAPAEDTPSAWREWYETRVAYRRSVHDEAEAERLTFGEAQCISHARHTPRGDGAACAGCGVAMGNRRSLDFVHGARVHFEGGTECLERYGRAWRGAATTRLRRLGIVAPPGWRDL